MVLVEVGGQDGFYFSLSHFFGELDDLGNFHILVLQGNIGHPQLVGHADEPRCHGDGAMLRDEI